MAEKRLGSKKKRLSHKRPVTHASEPAFKSDLRPCTLCRKGAHEGGAGRLLYCGPATWVHINCIMWAQHIPRLPSGELWFVHSVLLRAWKRRCSGCGDFGASVACSSIHCAERFHFPCALKAGAAFVQGGRVYCAKHSTKERLKRLTTVQGDTHFARLRAFVEPWWTRERLPRGSREGLEQSEKAGQEPGQKDDQAAEASEEAGQPVTNLEPGQAAGQAVEPAQQTAEARAGAPRDLPAGGSEAVTAGTGGEPAVRNGSDAGRSIPEADGPGPDPDGREIKRARLDGPELESEPVLTTQAAGERELEPTDGIAGQSVPATNVVSGESDGRQPLESGDAAGGSELPAGDVEASLSEGPVHTGFGLDPMQIDIKTEGNVGVPMQEERGERPLSAAPSDSAGPSGGNNMHDNGPPVESTNTTRFLQVSLPRADSLRFESSSPRRSPGSFASPIAGLSIVKGKRAKRSRLEDSWGSGQLLPGGPTPARNHPPWEEDDSETPPGEGPRLVQFLRVGALSVESLGELVHDQRGFHSLTQLYPVGFRAWRVHWSTQRPNQRCLYLLEIVRTAYGPLFRIMAWGEVGRRREPEGAAPVNPPMHPITASRWVAFDCNQTACSSR